MSKITENDIELLSIEELENLGWDYIYGPDIAPDGNLPERKSYEEVLLVDRLFSSLSKINPKLPPSVIDDAVKQIQRITSSNLITNNEDFHKMITDGVDVQINKNGDIRGEKVWLVDFNKLSNNEFLCVNQYTVIENNQNKRPDVVLFINGIPLVVIELKNPADEDATIRKAFEQLQTYKILIPSLFNTNSILIASDGLEARAGTISSEYSRFMPWKTADGKVEASPLTGQLETLVKGMLNKETLLDLIRHFIVFEKTKKEDPETGISQIFIVKKLAAYHQYFAVNKAVTSSIEAAKINHTQKAGVIWHTQGSGKSLSMVFYTGKLVLELDNPTVVVLTDRNDLDDQLFDTFAFSTQLLRQAPVQATSRDNLKDLLKVASGGIVFTTVQKFFPENGNVYDLLSDRSNIVVIADEAHRSHYGFKARAIDSFDENGEIIGQRIVYGFAKYIRDALPNATFIGFTGTPIEFDDKNTPAVFGNYIDIYDISRAVEDKNTVPIYYESRLAKVNLDDEGRKLIKELDKDLKKDDLTAAQKAKAKWTKLESIVGSAPRIKNIAKDIIEHFEERQKVFYKGKALIVTMSRRIAAELHEEIIKLRPNWYSDKLKEGKIKVVMSASSSDGPLLAKHHTNRDQRRTLADRMKDSDDELQLVIVCDMWLTGFDVPCLHTMYFDKPIKGHNLMQAIARVNRVFGDKPGGLIVDYLGIATDLKKALSFYSDSGGKGDPAIPQAQAVELMHEKLEVVSQLFHGFPYEEYFEASISQKLSIILQAEDHILSLDNGKNRFLREVIALSKAFAIAIPHPEAIDVKEEVAFIQAVKARLMKFEPGNGRTTEDIEVAIRQVIDGAIVSEKVIDIFDAAGLKKPDISILSEEFLAEIEGMEHKNLAIEVLKKLLNDEIKIRSKHNIVQSKALLEMLEDSIRKYQNKIITAVEVIQELIKLAKDIKKADERGEELNLSQDELAFYDAVAANESAREVLGDEVLRDLARVLVDRVRKNVTIDWTIKESVRAKLKVIVKRTLRQYGYPPDKQAIATETVLKQAELLADIWSLN